ncbi:arsenite methyltransferase isoform 2-T2 [Geothlypis trichas]
MRVFPVTFLLGIKAVLNTTKLQQSGLGSVASSPCALGRLFGMVGLCAPGSPILLQLRGLCRGSVTLLQVACLFLSPVLCRAYSSPVALNLCPPAFETSRDTAALWRCRAVGEPAAGWVLGVWVQQEGSVLSTGVGPAASPCPCPIEPVASLWPCPGASSFAVPVSRQAVCQGPGEAGAAVRTEAKLQAVCLPGQHRILGRSWAESGCGPATGGMATPIGEQIHQEVQDYYGKELQKSEDLKTNACITSARPVSKLVRDALERIHEEVVARYYGCGLVIPECLTSCWILDLGSGSGRDCYLLSQLVGEQGHVTGIDMTEGQVEVAKKHIAYHMDKFGYQKPNVEFFHGYMEKLGDAGLADESYDIVISNCVINLAPDKRAVLQEAFRVLKPGGEMYFSDVYASQRLSESIRKHRVLWGECLAGALYWRDLYSIAEEVGFSPPCLVTASPITIGDKELEGIATAALFPQLTACSRCRLAAGPGQDRSPTVAASWGTSESWCLMPTSPSRFGEAG